MVKLGNMFGQYDLVEIIKLNCTFKKEDVVFGFRLPKIGDTAFIVEIYSNPRKAYELECVQEDGDSPWMATFEENDAELKLIKKSEFQMDV